MYKLVVDAEDGEGLSAIQKAEVYISVTGRNTALPEFERPMYRFTVSEDVDPDKSVGAVEATYNGQSTGEVT